MYSNIIISQYRHTSKNTRIQRSFVSIEVVNSIVKIDHRYLCIQNSEIKLPYLEKLPHDSPLVRVEAYATL